MVDEAKEKQIRLAADKKKREKCLCFCLWMKFFWLIISLYLIETAYLLPFVTIGIILARSITKTIKPGYQVLIFLGLQLIYEILYFIWNKRIV